MVSKIYYHLTNLHTVLNGVNGAIASTLINNEVPEGRAVFHLRDNYKHNFWTEIRGGRRIDTFEVFKKKYTYLDN
jgi:hypothetical protein